MAYTISTWLAIYFVLWWVTLFVTLPFGIRSQHEDGSGAPGTDPGAPIMSRMGVRLIWTTLLWLARGRFGRGWYRPGRLAGGRWPGGRGGWPGPFGLIVGGTGLRRTRG